MRSVRSGSFAYACGDRKPAEADAFVHGDRVWIVGTGSPRYRGVPQNEYISAAKSMRDPSKTFRPCTTYNKRFLYYLHDPIKKKKNNNRHVFFWARIIKSPLPPLFRGGVPDPPLMFVRCNRFVFDSRTRISVVRIRSWSLPMRHAVQRVFDNIKFRFWRNTAGGRLLDRWFFQ